MHAHHGLPYSGHGCAFFVGGLPGGCDPAQHLEIMACALALDFSLQGRWQGVIDGVHVDEAGLAAGLADLNSV